MQHLYAPGAEVYDLPACEQARRRALKELVAAHVIALGQLAAVGDHAAYDLDGQREAAAEPVQLGLVGAEVRVVPVSAYVIPVYVRGHRRDGLVRKR